MKTRLSASVLALSAFALLAGASEPARETSNGQPYPEGWRQWATIAVSHRTDNQTMRVILGNEVAVAAARSGQTNPWPDGAVLGKVVWKETDLERWPAAKGPGEFVHAEFMFKDAQAHAETGGWAWARWIGAEQAAFNEGMGSCTGCHTPVADRDWVFTDPAAFPR